MGDKSKIEWTDATWNPIRARNKETGKVGWYCARVSEGCRNCYAARMNVWRGNGVDFAADQLSKVELFLDEKILSDPLLWKRPRMIFPCSMTDLFADFVPEEWIRAIFQVMAQCPDHTFQVTTKRPERMRAFMSNEQFMLNPATLLPHVWLGVSVEDQKTADERIPLLLQTPAAKRWVSYEPALGPVDFTNIRHTDKGIPVRIHPLSGVVDPLFRENYHERDDRNPRLDWIVAGGESGPSSRVADPQWFRDVRDQCRSAGVSFFMKQMGGRRSHNDSPIPADLMLKEYPNAARKA